MEEICNTNRCRNQFLAFNIFIYLTTIGVYYNVECNVGASVPALLVSLPVHVVQSLHPYQYTEEDTWTAKTSCGKEDKNALGCPVYCLLIISFSEA